MPRWIVKAAVQGVISLLPRPQRANLFFQQHVTRSLAFDDTYFLQKFRHLAPHAELIHGVDAGGSGPTVLDLGTGWYPVVPVGLWLSGAGHVVSVDLNDHVTRDRVLDTARRYLALEAEGLLEGLRPDRLAVVRKVVAAPGERNGHELLAALGVRTVVGDARDLPLGDGAVHLITSNNTLEHIPPDVLHGILVEFGRVARSDAVMQHYIDLADHYAGFDRRITAYNFLRFSDRTWRWYNNRLHYQNRLRVNDYRALHEAAGWHVTAEKNGSRPVEDLRSVPLDDRWKGYSDVDLRVCKSLMTSRPAPEG